ncbi:Carbonyl reductase [NADPH] 1 [Smittium culicis]|uniref:Carbonyl reductase [NADPH] 1 n=1 Tax=Smittium culicis TaxID=133412 RepID=A0A1R1YRE6_9FUNG|nr:Carbonyl reductase [NADPH] 1 [Smittium culicis]
MRLVVVTGANKGIGYAITKFLYADTTIPSKIFLTSRNESLGLKAVNDIKSEYKGQSTASELFFHQLDVRNESSIIDFRNYLESNYGKKGIDVLVNNAGISHMTRTPNADNEKDTIDTNYFATVNVTEHLLGLMNDKGRVVFISSTLGSLTGNYSDALKQKFLAQDLTLQQLNDIENGFVEAAYKAETEKRGYLKGSYTVSKTGVTAYTRILARDYKSDPRKLLFASCCPGWVRTDMGGPNAALSVEDGIKMPIHLINGNYDSLINDSGRFFFKGIPAKY